MGKIDEKTKQYIIADYVILKNFAEVARKYNISPSYVRKIVNSNAQLKNKLEDKKKQNIEDIFNYMDSKVDDIKEFTDHYFDRLKNKNRMKYQSLRDVTGAWSVVMDKFIKMRDIQNNKNDNNSEDETGVMILPLKIEEVSKND